MWIDRTISRYFETSARGLSLFPAWLVLGPRQIGKSSLLLHHSKQDRQLISLDNLEVRNRANRDPQLFANTIKFPVIVDEIQYAPQLLSPLKEMIDKKKCGPGDIWLTGSQNFEVMQGVHETLAGRIAILNLYGLTDLEKKFDSKNLETFFSNILETMFPKIFGLTDQDARSLYLSSYITTYIERDIRELLGIEKRREFELFTKLCAFRTAQLVNYDSLAKDVGVSPTTAKQWLSLLSDSFLIRIVQPWHSNQNKRLIKSPKIFFVDTGICAYLAGWTNASQTAYGPMAGHLYETHVLSNIFIHLKHLLKSFSMYFWRTKDGDEIDCLLEVDGKIIPIEVKMGSVDLDDLVDLKSTQIKNITHGFVISLTGNHTAVPIKEGWSLISLQGILNILTNSPVEIES